MTLIAEQVYIFLYAILAGALAAFLYDILRIKRRAIKTGVIIISLEDILYWLVAAVLLFLIVYNSNSGEMRGFIFIGNIIGAVLYESLLSKIVITSSVMIINLIKRLLLFIWKIISFPFILAYKIISVPVRLLLRLITKVLRFFGRAAAGIFKKAGAAAAGETKRIGNKVKVLGSKAGGYTRKKVKKMIRQHKKKKKVRKKKKNLKKQAAKQEFLS